MNLHRILPAVATAIALLAGVARPVVAGTIPQLYAVPAQVTGDAPAADQICIVNPGGSVELSAPSPTSPRFAVVLTLPTHAKQEQVKLTAPDGWELTSREFQPDSGALLFWLAPTHAQVVKAQGVAGCLELDGVRTSELGPIGLAVAAHVEPEEPAPRARR